VMSPRPGRISSDISVDLGDRDFATREASAFFEKVTDVREALRFEEASPRFGEAST
jgi:NitT/TauT family transport system ATP-binding protein